MRTDQPGEARPATFPRPHGANLTRPLILFLLAIPLFDQSIAAQNGLGSGRSRTARRGDPEFQLGAIGSRSGFAGRQETGVGFFVGLRLPIQRWLFANVETGHVYHASSSTVAEDPPNPPPAVGLFVRTTSELTEAVPLAIPTGFFAARLSSQLGLGTGARLRVQIGTRRRNATHQWLPTAGVAVQFPSRSTPVFLELEAARYRVPYQEVREEFLNGALVTRTTAVSGLAPRRGIELVARLGFSFGPAERGRRR